MPRKRRFDFSVLAVPLVVLAILILVQLLASRFVMRADLTTNELHSLSEKTVNVLDELDGSPLSATAFYAEDDHSRERIRSLFREYAEQYREFDYRIVDPARNPRLVEDYGVGSNRTVVLEHKGRDTTVSGQREEDITNGIHRLAEQEPTVVYFLTGHGEKSPEGEYGRFASALENENYEVRELLLLREEEIPTDAECVVIGSPKNSLDKHEIELLTDYVQRGGSLLVNLDPYRDSGLEPFLNQYGVELRFDAIVDERSKMMGGDYLFPIVSDYTSHSITRSLDAVTLYPLARSLELVESAPSGAEVRPIARTGPETWAEMDHETLSEGDARFDPDEDVRGPHTIAAAVTLGTGEAEGEGRMVVFGDSDFAGDEHLEIAGNENLALSAIAWLTRDQTLIGIRSREPSHTPVVLTENESQAVFWLSVVLIPALSALFGLVTWILQRWKR